jgi:hypothetical protein
VRQPGNIQARDRAITVVSPNGSRS